MIEHLIKLFNRFRPAKKSETLTKTTSNPRSVVILVPVGSHIEPSTDEALRKLESFGYTVWRKYGWSAIDQGRCVLAQEALDAGFEHLFWIDSDIAFWPKDVKKILSLNLPFVTAPYSVKGWPSLTTEFLDKNIILGEKGGLYEARYAATGFMYTHKSVYESIVSKFQLKRVKIWGGQHNVYPYFFPLIHNEEYLGEDFAFCHRAREAGIRIFSDTRVRLAHIGKYSYSFAFLKNGPIQEPKTINYKQSDVYHHQ